MNNKSPAVQRPGFNIRLNAILGIFGIYALGIFLTWYISAILTLPDGAVGRSAVNALIQTLCTIVIPYAWAMKRLGFSLGDLGLRLDKLGLSILLGCLLYSLALAAFIHCSADPLIRNHAVGKVDLASAAGLVASMSLIAAGTDLATRGFVLLTLARYASIPIAVFVQNLAWFLGHIHEINLLTNCLGYWLALGLTLTLGVLGDVIALKTRNVVGLAIAHVMLNIGLTIYIRGL